MTVSLFPNAFLRAVPSLSLLTSVFSQVTAVGFYSVCYKTGPSLALALHCRGTVSTTAVTFIPLAAWSWELGL